MDKSAILAMEEALLSNMFTVRGLACLLVKKGIITEEELKKAILNTEVKHAGAGVKDSHKFLEKREPCDRRETKAAVKTNCRKNGERRDKFVDASE
jgi:hypothetical protein